MTVMFKLNLASQIRAPRPVEERASGCSLGKPGSGSHDPGVHDS